MRAAGRLEVGSALTRLLARSGAYSVQRGYAAVICGPVYLMRRRAGGEDGGAEARQSRMQQAGRGFCSGTMREAMVVWRSHTLILARPVWTLAFSCWLFGIESRDGA